MFGVANIKPKVLRFHHMAWEQDYSLECMNFMQGLGWENVWVGSLGWVHVGVELICMEDPHVCMILHHCIGLLWKYECW